jgi:hypothetical protein
MGWFLVAAAVVGTASFTVLSAHGLRAGLSFLAGLVLAGGIFAVGQFNLRMANQISPGITLAVAMFSYLITVVGLGLLLAASRPNVVEPWAIATGLVVGVVGWVGRLIDVSRVRPERP